MEIKFFTEIAKFLPEGATLTLSLIKIGEEITVSVLPRVNDLKDQAATQIIPKIMRGTPEELDIAFSDNLETPLQKAYEVLLNMNAFEKSVTDANSKSKASAEQKKKFDDLVKKADEYEKKKDLKSAITCLIEAKKFTKEPHRIQKRIDQLRNQMNTNSLFTDETTEETPLVFEDNREVFEKDEEQNEELNKFNEEEI